MPRREGPKAEAAVAKARESRWRYLLRNPEFRAELNELRRHYREVGENYKWGHLLRDGTILKETWEAYDKRNAFREKWELYVPDELLYPYYNIPDISPQTVEPFESFLERKDGDFIGSAVSAVDPWDVYGWGEYGGPPRTDPGPGPGRFLEIEVDLSYPDDVILSVISEELRKARRTHPRSRQRQRFDKTDFYLNVYDLAEKGETFRAIAKSLESHVSTVKSAYLAAYRNIYGVKPKPSKRTLPMDTFDWENLDDVEHFRTCRDCKKAKTADEMCPPLRLHVTQEHRGQRESTGHDTRR